MQIGLIVAGGVVALIALLYAVRLIALHYTTGLSANTIAKHYKSEDIVRQDPVADFRGLLSKGVVQVRGNGALVLTKNEIAFFQIAPASELKIPCSNITGVSIVHDYNGYSGRPLLQVQFTTTAGSADAMAWYVRGSDDWKNDIDGICAKK